VERGHGLGLKHRRRWVRKGRGMDNSIENNSTREIVKKRRGRKKKSETNEKENRDQKKFFVDASKDEAERELIIKLLEEANNKNFGRKIILKDLVYYALPKLNQKDIEKIQESALSEMEKVERALAAYNEKNEIKLGLGEFLVKKLGIH
jgi:hypothetical protein